MQVRKGVAPSSSRRDARVNHIPMAPQGCSPRNKTVFRPLARAHGTAPHALNSHWGAWFPISRPHGTQEPVRVSPPIIVPASTAPHSLSMLSESALRPQTQRQPKLFRLGQAITTRPHARFALAGKRACSKVPGRAVSRVRSQGRRRSALHRCRFLAQPRTRDGCRLLGSTISASMRMLSLRGSRLSLLLKLGTARSFTCADNSEVETCVAPDNYAGQVCM